LAVSTSAVDLLERLLTHCVLIVTLTHLRTQVCL